MLGGEAMKQSYIYISLYIFCVCSYSIQADSVQIDDVESALKKSVRFFDEQVGVEGGYVWQYSADLSKREGEGKVGITTVWLQPPGTPFIGEAFLTFYQLTGDSYYLEVAEHTADVLVKGQLHSGGWDHRIELDPKDRKRYAYRVDGDASEKRNRSTLDDDKTQSALRFLIRFDTVTGFKNQRVHEAVMYGLDGLIGAQFPNGGWGHGFVGKPEQHPVLKASYDEQDVYSRRKDYWVYYTLNDNLMSDVMDTLTLAVQTYENNNYLQSLLNAGDFLLLAQMPNPQPGWCQQYDYDMQPAWARKFEPAAITGSESQSVMMSLMDLYEFTGKKKYLAPIPSALEYYQSSLLPDGRLARFYEPKTNKPLYFTREYELTYDDDDLPTHYGFKVGSRLDRIEKRYKTLVQEEWTAPKKEQLHVQQPSIDTVKAVIDAMDERGAWVEDGRMRYWGENDDTTRVINPRTFVRNATQLAGYIYHNQTKNE